MAYPSLSVTNSP